MPTITVALRTKNAGAYLEETLAVLARQRTRPNEVLILDSGSTDGTPERAAALGCRVVPFPPDRFTHARSTNAAIAAAESEIVALLSQDATPSGEGWLEELVLPFEDPTVSAVFARQVPRPDAYPLEAWEIRSAYPGPEEGKDPGVVFSNVSSAIRKSAWARRPFDESLRIAEDRAWALAAKGAGERVVYAPRATVLHSHAYTLRALYERCWEEGRAFVQMGERPMNVRTLVAGFLSLLSRDLSRFRKEGSLDAFARAIPYRWVQMWALYRGGRCTP